MIRMQLIVATLALGLAVGLVCCETNVYADTKQADQTDQHSVTVFPIAIEPSEGRTLEFRTTLATVVGSLLQRADVNDVELAQTEFIPPDGADTTKIADDFGRFVVEHPVETQYALFAQLVGTPKTGVKAIVTILVDRSGKVILAERDTHETFDKYSNMRPKNPMTCSIFVARRVCKLWKLPDPLRPGTPSDGSMAALLRKESAVPPQAALAAMQERLEAMKRGLAEREVTVYPIHLAKGTAPDCTKQLVDSINRRGLFKAVTGTVAPGLQVKGSYNEQRVLWGSARALRKFIKNAPPASEYALYVDYGICGPDIETPPGMKREAGYVHLILCNKAGELLMVDFQNSHQSDFKKIEPRTCAECNRLALIRLVARLGK